MCIPFLLPQAYHWDKVKPEEGSLWSEAESAGMEVNVSINLGELTELFANKPAAKKLSKAQPKELKQDKVFYTPFSHVFLCGMLFLSAILASF